MAVELVDSWDDEEGETRTALYKDMGTGAPFEYYGFPVEGGHSWRVEAPPEVAVRHAWLVRELACESLKFTRLEEKAARLERENDELARGILELQRKLTVAEQAHFLYHEATIGRLSAAEKRTKYAEDRLQTALNLGETFYQRERRAIAEVKARGQYFLPILPPAGDEPEARWALTELGARALEEGFVLVKPKISALLEHWAAGKIRRIEAAMEPVEDLKEVDRNHAELREAFGKWVTPLASSFPESWQRPSGPNAVPQKSSYDLAAACARCGRPYREHIEPEGPECDGFLASTEGRMEHDHQPKILDPLIDAGGGLRFRCCSCRLMFPLEDRAPSTMPLCNQCWRKEP